MFSNCMCGEEVKVGEKITRMGDGTSAHKECLLRSVMGNLAHVKGECSYVGECNEKSDKTFREEALELDEYIRTEHRTIESFLESMEED